MEETVSVIVPVYNVEKYLERCVESILNQTHRKLEVILVDDGSSDRCPEICDCYAEKDSRVKVIHKKNGGLSSARNAGLKSANGDYISFVDSDDYVEPDMVEKMLSAMLKSKADLCICNNNRVDENGKIKKRTITSPIINEVISRDTAMEKLVMPKYWFYVTVWNKLYKRELFSDLSFREGKINEDEFLIHHLFDRCNTVCCIEDYLYNYTQRSDSIMHSPYTVKKLDVWEAFIDRAQFFAEKECYSYAYWCLNQVLAGLSLGSERLKDKQGKSRILSLKTQVCEIYFEIENKISPRLFDKIRYKLRNNDFIFYMDYKARRRFKKMPKKLYRMMKGSE